MSQFPNPTQSRRQAFNLDYSGLRENVLGRFMNAVYSWMCVGLAVTAAVAWWVSTNPALMKTVLSGGGFLLLLVAEIALVVVISRAVNKIGATAATALFLLFAALNGLTLSVIFVVYSLPSIGATFLVTAGMFGAMSVIGFVTKIDLTRIGSFLFMALIGFIIATVVNYFVASTFLGWIITYAGIALFLGLTVYDTQRLKYMAYQVQGNAALAARMSIVGSLMLYLDFVNLFILMLQLMGSRR
jgi:FtsH-binding integral membrane protein